jgi:hypothetical protein
MAAEGVPLVVMPGDVVLVRALVHRVLDVGLGDLVGLLQVRTPMRLARDGGRFVPRAYHSCPWPVSIADIVAVERRSGS